MIRIFGNTAAAELVKLYTLPAVLAAMLGTVGAAIALATAVASTGATDTGASDAVQVTLLTIPFLQIGPILIGILSVATEYAGSQARTTLTATPNRSLLLAGKFLGYLATAAVTSAAALGAGFAAAVITLTVRNAMPTGDLNGWPVVGAGLYLVLMGLLGFALTVLLRSLIPPLVTMLGLVFIASPLLSGITGHARWLPDRAGSLLYVPDADSVLSAGTGTLILLAWIAATVAAAAVRFLTRDA